MNHEKRKVLVQSSQIQELDNTTADQQQNDNLANAIPKPPKNSSTPEVNNDAWKLKLPKKSPQANAGDQGASKTPVEQKKIDTSEQRTENKRKKNNGSDTATSSQPVRRKRNIKSVSFRRQKKRPSNKQNP